MSEERTGRLTWLHISDIHFYQGTEWRDNSSRKGLLRYLETIFKREKTPKPDFIFCTGDVAFGEAPAAPIRDQYQVARAFFEQLRVICGDEDAPLPIERLYVVPGNHDVNRKSIDSLAQQSLMRYAEQASQHEAKVNAGFARREAAFMRALARLDEYAGFVDAYLPHQADPEGRHVYGRTLLVNGIEVGIAGFNSAWCCSGDEDDRRLWLAADYQFDRARESLEQAKLRIGLLHHPIDWLNTVDHEVARRRIPADFDFWLHGHSHSAWVEPQQSHVSICAGAVGAETQAEFGINFVSLDIPSAKGTVHLHGFSTRSRGWTIFPVADLAPHGEWLFDLSEQLRERLKLLPGDGSAGREGGAEDELSEALVSAFLLAVDALAAWTAHPAFQLLAVKIRTYFARRSTPDEIHMALANAWAEEKAALEADWTAEGVRQVVQALERACRQPAVAQILGALVVEHTQVSGDHLQDLLGDRIGSDQNSQALLSDACRDRTALLLSNVRARLEAAEGFRDVFELAARLTSMSQLAGFSRKIASSLDRLAVQRDYLQREAEERNLDGRQIEELADYLSYIRDHELALSGLPLTSAAAQERPPPRLKDIFVPLQVREVPRDKHAPRQRSRSEALPAEHKPPPVSEAQEAEIGGMLAVHRRVALLAPVGSGKTTLLRYTALAFADARPGDVAGWPGGTLVPIFIRLRSFAGFLKARHDFADPSWNALIAYLSHYYNVSQGLELEPKFFRSLLGAGGCGVFLDGLDEVPLIQRTEVAAHVSEFIRHFGEDLAVSLAPKSQARRENIFLLSSRPKGFEPVASFLGSAKLVRRELKPLEPKGIRSLVRRILEYIEPDQNALNQDFAELSRVIGNREDLAQLASTPLFCTSLVQVYKIHGAELPARRVDVLEEIVTLLLGVWKAQDHRSPRFSADEDDIDRDLELHSRVEIKRRRLAHIAIHMQLTGKRAEIDFPSLVATLIEFLRDREGVQERIVERLAERFIVESHERSGLLIETDPSEPRIFAFSHEGFREFLVAEAMRNQGDAKLTSLVLENMDDPAWEEVIVLVAANRKLSDAAREHLLEECAAAAERRLDEENVESWARHLTVIGRMVHDMAEYLPPHIRTRYQNKLLAAMARNDCPLAQRCGLALSLDEIGWRAPGTFGFDAPHTLGEVAFRWALYPVTNGQYRRFLEAADFSDSELWEQPEAPTLAGGSRVLDTEFAEWWSSHKEYDKRVPKSWYDPKFGIAHPGLPVVGISWFEAIAYCRWLERHWTELEEAKSASTTPFVHVRLPNGDEWDIATGLAAYRALGDLPLADANVGKVIDQTMPVGVLSAANATGAVLEMIGNIWEWQAGYADRSFRGMALRGGSFATGIEDLDRDFRGWAAADRRENDVGFRVLIELREHKA